MRSQTEVRYCRALTQATVWEAVRGEVVTVGDGSPKSIATQECAVSRRKRPDELHGCLPPCGRPSCDSTRGRRQLLGSTHQQSSDPALKAPDASVLGRAAAGEPVPKRGMSPCSRHLTAIRAATMGRALRAVPRLTGAQKRPDGILLDGRASGQATAPAAWRASARVGGCAESLTTDL